MYVWYVLPQSSVCFIVSNRSNALNKTTKYWTRYPKIMLVLFDFYRISSARNVFNNNKPKIEVQIFGRNKINVTYYVLFDTEEYIFLQSCSLDGLTRPCFDCSFNLNQRCWTSPHQQTSRPSLRYASFIPNGSLPFKRHPIFIAFILQNLNSKPFNTVHIGYSD